MLERLKPEDLKDNTLIKLKYVKLQNVQNITVSSFKITQNINSPKF